MSEPTKPLEPVESTGQEEFPPLQPAHSLPSVEEHAAVPKTTPKDPWQDSYYAAPNQPAPVRSPLLPVGITVAVAAVVVVALFIHTRTLQARLARLNTDLSDEKKHATELQAQLDHLSLPASARSPGLLIVTAVFGSGTQFNDVTDRVNELLHLPDAEFYAKPDWLQGDPTPGWRKELIIVYTYRGERHISLTAEDGKVSVAMLTGETRSAAAQ